MNENVFAEILGESLKREYAKFDDAPEHKFSLKHRLAMRHIFSHYGKARKEPRVTCRSLKRRVFIALAIVIFMTFLVGGLVISSWEKFRGVKYADNTHIFPDDIENCPETIEYIYSLAYVPEGFELFETDSSPIDVYTRYKNKLTNENIILSQVVKSVYDAHLNTEHHPIEEVDINGITGLCIDFSDDTHDHSLVVWDNGDYILEITADLDKEGIVDLAKSTNFEIFK